LNIDVKVTGQDDRNVGVRLVIANDFLDAVGLLHEGSKETAFDFGVRGIRMQPLDRDSVGTLFASSALQQVPHS
jgi:hypothetical protein